MAGRSGGPAVSRNIWVRLEPGQWRPDAGPAPEEGPLDVQVIVRTAERVLGDNRRPTGWVRVQAWRYLPGEPAPELVRIQVRAELLDQPEPGE